MVITTYAFDEILVVISINKTIFFGPCVHNGDWLMACNQIKTLHNLHIYHLPKLLLIEEEGLLSSKRIAAVLLNKTKADTLESLE